ncbi:hypothetical protein NHP190012_11240 [Helicobacter sp. NHP19-012]|uniref:Uncharacterized protein n=1 Tax=Helicobacter gastrofelis TaxID=2849642 RepID=A0ABM7SF72_9HELI|nr:MULTISPECIES: hypothetical protein [unclassified Helicobacter]BCZ19482.1 hypothetical protein NHP190012_11240 [Helicobacter sp. NHP19-012]GMB96469.1 hypothetical protein NHP22001_10580 [Helicobacter sp. NHP22-001]
MSNEWESNDTEGINTSQEAIKRLKHFNALMNELQEKLDSTTSPMLQEGLEIGIRDCIDNMQSVLTTRTEIDPRDKSQTVATTKNNTTKIVPHKTLLKNPHSKSYKKTQPL